MFFIPIDRGLHDILVSRPTPAGDAAHDFPGQGAAKDKICFFAAVQQQAETAIAGVADSYTAVKKNRQRNIFKFASLSFSAWHSR